jgi:DNA transformation protein and related proteins
MAAAMVSRSGHGGLKAVSARQLAFAAELFEGLGEVRVRRMFGGAGIYAHDVMFALIDDDVIYLKVDGALKQDLADQGSRAWIYTAAKGPRAGVPEESGYWSLPEDALDDPDAACAWGRRALAVAVASRAPKPRKPRR